MKWFLIFVVTAFGGGPTDHNLPRDLVFNDEPACQAARATLNKLTQVEAECLLLIDAYTEPADAAALEPARATLEGRAP
jgi:hypothetical protein